MLIKKTAGYIKHKACQITERNGIQSINRRSAKEVSEITRKKIFIFF